MEVAVPVPAPKPFDLVYKNEKTLLAVAAVFSGLIWAGLIVASLGTALFYFGILFIVYLFAHSAFIAHLKGSGVRITPEQYQDLHKMLRECCARVNMDPVPDAYLLHMNGLFNALATRFLGRNFVVLYSDIVDAMDKNPDAVRFYIGHELGHITRGHLKWGVVLLPANLLPLIGKAYARAREYTCDRFGLYCCVRPEDAVHGMAALAAGGRRWGSLDVSQFVKQSDLSGGFWMSYHELTSSYPWLTKRMAWLKALAASETPKFPRRSFWGGFFAFFGSAKMLFVVCLILAYLGFAMWAAKDLVSGGTLQSLLEIAKMQSSGAGVDPNLFPSAPVDPSAPLSPTAEKIFAATTAAEVADVKTKIEAFVAEKNEWPLNNATLGLDALSKPTPEIDQIVVNDGMIDIYLDGDLTGKQVRLSSDVVQGKVVWTCITKSFAAPELPPNCSIDTSEDPPATTK